jgi:hypothetical protein
MRTTTGRKWAAMVDFEKETLIFKVTYAKPRLLVVLLSRCLVVGVVASRQDSQPSQATRQGKQQRH